MFYLFIDQINNNVLCYFYATTAKQSNLGFDDLRASVVASNTKQESNTVKLTTYLLTSLTSLHFKTFYKIILLPCFDLLRLFL